MRINEPLPEDRSSTEPLKGFMRLMRRERLGSLLLKLNLKKDL